MDSIPVANLISVRYVTPFSDINNGNIYNKDHILITISIIIENNYVDDFKDFM